MLCLTYDLRFIQSRSIRGIRKGIANFISNDKSILVTYQPVYITDWEDSSLSESSGLRFLENIPDISIDFLKKGTSIILDAKNSYLKSKGRPYRHQMTNYMTTSNSKYGILVHSDSESPVLFNSISRKSTNQQIIWTSVSPLHEDTTNSNNLNKIMNLVSLCLNAS